MARYDSKTNSMRGQVGDVIHYVRNGVEYVRRKPDYSGWKVPKGSQAAVNAFQEVSLYFKFLPAELQGVWRTAAAGTVCNCRTHFIRKNFGAFPFEEKKPLPYYERLLMSDGEVPLPLNMAIAAGEEAGVWRLTWDTELALPHVSADDRLCLVEIHTETPRQVNMIAGVEARRHEGACTFRLRRHLGREAHVYCFFGNAAGRQYSVSRYFRVDDAPRDEETAAG